MTRILAIHTAEQLQDAIIAADEALGRGEMVAFPVEFGYAVAVDAFDQRAVARLQQVRGAPAGSGLPVLVSAPQTVDGFANGMPMMARDLIRSFWPGLLTLVLPTAMSWDLGDGDSKRVAVRQPLHPVALALSAVHGPIAATSAAKTGKRASCAADAVAQLGDALSLVIDLGARPEGPGSTIIDLTVDPPRVVRVGAVPLSDLQSTALDLGIEFAEHQP
jgi:L-threonylcarbamoyladenylate synthase